MQEGLEVDVDVAPASDTGTYMVFAGKCPLVTMPLSCHHSDPHGKAGKSDTGTHMVFTGKSL